MATEKVKEKIKCPSRGGRRPNAGRKKGTPNKLTADVKAMILGALNARGGQEYLERQAEANPTAFMTLVGKVLPLTISGDSDNPLVITTVADALRIAERKKADE